jgi:hypothetical protein
LGRGSGHTFLRLRRPAWQMHFNGYPGTACHAGDLASEVAGR